MKQQRVLSVTSSNSAILTKLFTIYILSSFIIIILANLSIKSIKWSNSKAGKASENSDSLNNVSFLNLEDTEVAFIGSCKLEGWLERTLILHQTFLTSLEASMMNLTNRLSWCEFVEFSDLQKGVIHEEFIAEMEGIRVLRSICFKEYDVSIYRLFVKSEHRNIIVIPNWGYDHSKTIQNWKTYHLAFYVNGRVCFWPEVFEGTHERNISLKRFKRVNKFFPKVALASGPVENLWHAAGILNHMCTLQSHKDIVFVFQRQTSNLPDFFYDYSLALGIESRRIYILREPIRVHLALTMNWKRPDWSCLHKKLHIPFSNVTSTSFALVYYRNHSGRSRDIPFRIHQKFTRKLKNELKIDVISFTGGEGFEYLRNLFSQAQVVVGPHGAGLVNVLFTSVTTPIIEFITPKVFRAHQMNGGSSFGLNWWPIMIPNFHSEYHILQAVKTVKAAFLLSKKTQIK